jgi:polar amino acid transport system permease protein
MFSPPQMPPPASAGPALSSRLIEVPWPDVLSALLLTLGLTAFGIVFTLVVAMAVGLMRTARNVLVRGSARVFVEFFRSTSLVVQLFWLYFALNTILREVGFQLDKFGAAVLALGLCYGAYASEIVRGSVQAVPKGQWEASIALNMRPSVRMRRVILPQALPLMVGPFSVSMVELLKGTSLVSLIALTDITRQAILMRDQEPEQAYLIFGALLVLYFVLARLMTYGMRKLERRAKAAVGTGPAAPSSSSSASPRTAGLTGGVK